MKKAGDLLNVYFDKIQKKEGEQYTEFQGSWKKFAGEKIGLNSQIRDVTDGQLIIEIDHPGVKQLILMKEKQILRGVKREFPQLNITKIKFYFKNSGQKTVKNMVNKEIVEDKMTTPRPVDVDFAKLLEKMSKRSQE